MSLYNALQTRSSGARTLPDALNAMVPALVTRYNSEIGPRLLSRLPDEKLPTEPKAASSFRSRVSLLVEYSIIELLADFVTEDQPELNVTFNTLNEFADFFIRDENWVVQLRIDIKTLHDQSAEASARFTQLQSEIREFDDFVLYIAWQWQTHQFEGRKLVMPGLLGAVFIPATVVAEERDRRQGLSGASFSDDGLPLTARGGRDSNFGKVDRIVHSSRRSAADLDPLITQLLVLSQSQADSSSSVPEELARVEDLANEDDEVTDNTDDE